MIASKNKNQLFSFIQTYSVYLIYLALILVAAYLCFYKLDVASLQHWDEARHGVNAYEMYKTGNYIVNTYNYENDYFNLKPPLSYWGIILGFKLFGVSIFSMRFYSALSLFLTFLAVAFYLHKYYGKIAAVSGMLFFISCSDLFFRHAGRNADADAQYILLFTVALLFMLRVWKHTNYIYICGLLFSLAFLSKSWHALVLLSIGGIYLIFSGLWKQLKVSNYLLFLLCAFGPILLWAVVRYQYDGMEFLGQMFGVDVAQRISGSAGANPSYSFFTSYLLSYRPILLISIICGILLLFFLILRKSQKQTGRTVSETSVYAVRYTQTVLAFLLWVFVPLVVYNMSHTYYYWYIFPIYIPLIMIAAILIQKLYQFMQNKKSLFYCLMLVPAFLVAVECRNTLNDLDDLEVSGFQTDIKAAMDSHPELHQMDFYVEKTDNEYKESTYWEQAGLLAAELSGDLFCHDGGVDAFLKVPGNALIIVDPETYEAREDLLSPLQIVYENEYLILKK